MTREPRRSQFSIVDRRDGKPMNIGPAVLVDTSNSAIRIPWSLSPTGQMVAYTRNELDAVRSQHVELLDLTRGMVERFTSGRMPVWNRSGNQIAFTRSHLEGRDLYLKTLGSDRESRVGESSNNLKVSHDWHQDGTLLFGMQTPPGRPHSFWLVETEGSRNQRQWFPATATTSAPSFRQMGSSSHTNGVIRPATKSTSGAFRARMEKRRFPQPVDVRPVGARTARHSFTYRTMCSWK